MDKEHVTFDFSGVTISTTVKVKDSSNYLRWITIYPTLKNDTSKFYMGRLNLPLIANRTLDEHILHSIVGELSKVYFFVEDYPSLRHFEVCVEGFHLKNNASDKYDDYYKQSIELRKIITKDWLDSANVFLSLSESNI